MSAAPCFDFYPADFLADTMHCTYAQRGGYLMLLIHQWRHGSLPECERELAAIVGAGLGTWRKRLAPVLMRFFHKIEGGWIQCRLAEIAEEQAAAANARSNRARVSARARWEARRAAREAAGMPANDVAEACAEACAEDAPGMLDACSEHAGGMLDGCSEDASSTARGNLREEERNKVSSSLRSLGAAAAPPSGERGSADHGQPEAPSGGDAATGPTVVGWPDHAGRMRAASGFGAGASPRSVLFQSGRLRLQALTGLPERAARGVIAQLLRAAGDDATRVLKALDDAEANAPAEAVPWMLRMLRERRESDHESKPMSIAAYLRNAEAEERARVAREEGAVIDGQAEVVAAAVAGRG
jgi:uncharacterized protein YdaU (DUF1376 family)